MRQWERSTLPRRHAKNAGLLFGCLLSAGILYFIGRSLDWTAFFQEFKKLNGAYLLVFCALVMLSFWLRAIRWQLLLPSSAGATAGNLLEACFLGFFATMVLPLRAGEIVRPWYLSKIAPPSFSAGFASIITERVFDVFGLFVLIALCSSKLQNVPGYVTVGAQALGILALVIAVVMLLAYLRAEMMIAFGEKTANLLFAERAPELCEKLIEMGREFVEGLKAIENFGQLLLVLFWTLLLWLIIASLYQLALYAFGIFPPMSVGIVVCVLVALAVSAPSAPGFLGTFQLGCVLALSVVFGYSEEFAVAYSIVVHAIQALLLVIIGVFILMRRGLSFAEMRAEPSETGT